MLLIEVVLRIPRLNARWRQILSFEIPQPYIRFGYSRLDHRDLLLGYVPRSSVLVQLNQPREEKCQLPPRTPPEDLISPRGQQKTQ